MHECLLVEVVADNTKGVLLFFFFKEAHPVSSSVERDFSEGMIFFKDIKGEQITSVFSEPLLRNNETVKAL